MEGASCAAEAITLHFRVDGIPFPTPQDPEWEGGLLDYGRDWVDEQKIAVSYGDGMDLRTGDLGLWKYVGTALNLQGHTFSMGRRGKPIQADVPGGLNEKRTAAETIRLFGHGRQLWIVPLEKWLKP